MTPMTLDDAIRAAKARGVARLDAQQMLGHLLARPRTWVIAHADEALPPTSQAGWATLLDRRAAGEPLAYLLGEKEFHGLSLRVNADVLVPRPETETLVDWGLAQLNCLAPAARAVDLGTGSGAIALAIANARKDIEIWATDASAPALAVAQGNAAKEKLSVHFRLGDWWQAVAGERFHLALSNPPYIAEGDPHLPALRHEPRQALSSGPDGLDALRHLICHAPSHLLPGGWLLLEHGHDQAGAVRDCLTQRGFQGVETRPDGAGIPRCTGGLWPG
jgi:release factor glutamine methyltransferase